LCKHTITKKFELSTCWFDT